MSSTDLTVQDFSFGSDDIQLLASIKYWGIRAEAMSSTSFSRLRKHFMGEEGRTREQHQYVGKKHAWADEWRKITVRLLGIDAITPEERLGEQLRELDLTEVRKNALSVELATFTPYFELAEDSKEWDALSFDDDDRKRYLAFCSYIMGESPSTLQLTWQEFNKAIEKIVKANAGPDLTWVWTGLGAVVLIVLAPYMAGVIGGLMGLSGAAATSAGLALLGGGSLAAGGLGMTGGYIAVMAGGAILGYGSGSGQYRQKLRETSKEELLINCGKLYAACKVFNIYGDQRHEVCKAALGLQADLEADADLAFLQGKDAEGKQLEAKSMVMRSFRRLMRGDL